MTDYVGLFTSELDRIDCKYQIIDAEDHLIKIQVRAQNSAYTCYVDFDEGENNEQESSAHLMILQIAHASDDTYSNAIVACNALNRQYRWVKFTIDGDNDINSEMDIELDPNSAGEETTRSLFRLLNITDKSYPIIMKALYA